MDEDNSQALSVEVEVLTDKPTPEEMRKLLGNGASPDSPKSTRWAEFETEGLTPYTDLWDYSKGLGQNYVDIINRAVLLPNPTVQPLIAATYAAMHSQLIKIAPMLTVLGSTGTGKSALTKCLAGFREVTGIKVLGSESTFASLRNSVNHFRFKEFIDNQPVVGLDNEQPVLMVISDVKESFFQGEDGKKKFGWARCRWDRSEEIQAISLGNGENQYSYTFCPCIMQSANTFILKSEYAELYRRSTFIKTSHIESFDASDRVNWYANAENHIEPEMIDWTNCNQEFINFWEGDNDANILRYQQLKRQHGNLKATALEAGMSEHEYKTHFYLMITSRILFDLKPKEVVDLYLSHFKYCKENIVPESEGVTKLVQLVTSDWTHSHEQALKEVALSGLSLSLPKLKFKASEFRAKLDWYKSQQGVMFGASEASITNAMHELGFHIEKQQGLIYWVWNK